MSKQLTGVFSFLLLLVTGAATAAPGDPPEKTASAFYAASMKMHEDGVPDTRGRAKLRPHVSPALYSLLASGGRAEVHYAKVTKGESPPLMEGDLFSSNFEGVTTYKIGACEVKGDGASCSVALSYVDSQDRSTTNWTDTLFLVRVNGAWKVDDIAYGGDWDFGNHGKLTDTLKDVVRESQQPAN